MPFAVRAECPDWAAEPRRRAFGDRFDDELAALLVPAPLDIRVNEIKSLRDDVQKSLKASGISSQPTRLSPLGLRVEGRPPLAGPGLFTAGVIEVQAIGRASSRKRVCPYGEMSVVAESLKKKTQEN